MTLPCKLEKGAILPVYASKQASGMDVHAYLDHPVTIEPGETALIPTGVSMEIPVGFEIQVRPRSGLALKNALTVLNTPGTIDADYRGEIKIILINHGKQSFTVDPNMRIAQLVLARTYNADFSIQSSLSDSKRGDEGFGDSGCHPIL
ncbi:dUTP diphosphatase [Chlamydiia bacterium]|nr:dUTP diphosphatase [Chlamydiia bacterium]